MANSIQKKIKFSKGQITPELVERQDLELYDSSAQTMNNVVSTIYGGLRTRYGTKYIDTITNMNETQATSITSDVFSDTSKFSDPETKTSGVIGTNRLIAKLDFGEVVQKGHLVIKDLQVVPKQVISSGTPASGSFHLNVGTYEIEGTGAGAGGWWKADAVSGTGAVYKGTGYVKTDDTYSYTIGAAQSYGDGQATTITDILTLGGGSRTTTSGSASLGDDYEAINTVIMQKGADGKDGYNGGYQANALYGSTYGFGAGRNQEYGGTGFLSVKLIDATIKVKISASTDDTTYETLATKNITATANDILVATNGLYRYYKIEIDETSDFIFPISFSYVACSLSTGIPDKAKMIKYIFNNTQKYLLVLTNEKIQIFYNDILYYIVNATGLLQSYFPELKYTYKDDTIVFTHPDMPPKQLQRQSNGSFVWSNFSYTNTPYYAFNGETKTTVSTSITPSALEGTVKITASGSIFSSDWVGQKIDGNGGIVRITEYVSATVVNGITIIPFYTTDAIASWTKITGYSEVWSASRGYPRTCLFAQQRLWFGGSRDLPTHIWGSRLDDYNNFKNSGNYDNDSIDATMLGREPIVNMIEQRGIHIFTGADEWTAPEDSLTPDKFTLTKNTTNGSLSTVPPVLLGGVVAFIEKNGKSLLSYVYDDNQASFTTDNLSLYSNLINTPVSLDTENNSSRDRGDFIYLVLDDGTMLVACVVLNQGIFSLCQFTTTDSIKEVCCVSDTTYILVKRQSQWFLEKIVNVKTDCTTSQYINTTTISGLWQYDGQKVYVYSDNKYYGGYTVSGDSITLTSTPNENVNIGIGFSFELESNPIAINGKTTSIKKRIAKAEVVCKDTEVLNFCGQKQKNQRSYTFYSCTHYKDDVRFKITGEFYPIEVLSVQLNINYEG